MIDPAVWRAEVTTHPLRSMALAFATGASLVFVEPKARSARTLANLLISTVIAAARDAIMRRRS